MGYKGSLLGNPPILPVGDVTQAFSQFCLKFNVDRVIHQYLNDEFNS